MDSKHKKAQIVIAAIDSKRESFSFLLLQTNQKRGEFWQNVTGKVEGKESFEEGGFREAIEETKLNIENVVDFVDLGLTFEFIDQRKNRVVEKCFLIILDAVWDVKIDPHEHQDHKWIPMKGITPESVKYGSNFEALLKAKELLQHWGV